MSQSANPPTAESTTLQFGTLQTVGQGAAVQGRADPDHLPV